MDLRAVRWAAYPKKYIEFLAHLKEVVELRLDVDQQKVKQMLRLVWAYPELRKLDLRGRPVDVARLSEKKGYAEELGAARKPWACGKLDYLILTVRATTFRCKT